MGKREQFAAIGAAHAGLALLEHWAAACHVDLPGIGHESVGVIACGAAQVQVDQRRLLVVLGGREIGIGPAKWQHAVAAPWLAWVANRHGIHAVTNAAHAIGLARTSKRPAWRNYYSGTPDGAYTGLFCGGPEVWRVSPRYLSAYLACFAAVGLYAEDEDAKPALDWQHERTMRAL